jgi:hypothetical protein
VSVHLWSPGFYPSSGSSYLPFLLCTVLVH